MTLAEAPAARTHDTAGARDEPRRQAFVLELAESPLVREKLAAFYEAIQAADGAVAGGDAKQHNALRQEEL